MRLTAIGLFCLVLTGCGTVNYSVRSDKPVLLGNNLDTKHRVINHAQDKGKKLWLFWWTSPIGEKREDVLPKFARAHGDAVTNVRIHESYDFLDFLVQNWSVPLCGIPGFTNTLNEDFEADIVIYEEKE